jgi:hypothetical protein
MARAVEVGNSSLGAQGGVGEVSIDPLEVEARWRTSRLGTRRQGAMARGGGVAKALDGGL